MSVSGCSNQTTQNKELEANFTQKTKQEIKEKARIFTEDEFQSAEVPLNEYVQLSGEIIQSDRETDLVKGDRFILKSGSSRYQVFNEQEEPIQVGDLVTVYGEYYGFIKAIVIEGK
ncbi:hypothetical protein IGI37_001959 [Enterococcus sp. AZ194]|uniref:hypothetical protein n=1 Tax=Enterococcus sp. AZ194 TaxID=2774629 RepID=UPI003F288D5E